uniref:ANTAR domain-containing protein n=2 Tax=Paenibacillus athensensis TaxID=1967502 RepID=A0A4Y8PRN0_9BACL
MLQSFILIDELATSRAAASSASSPSRSDSAIISSESIPVAMLRDLGFRVHVAALPKELGLHIGKADAALLSVAPEQVEPWRARVLAQRSLPIFWWCDPLTFPSNECRMNTGIDGMIGPAMSAREVHCALLLGVNHYFQRTEWQQEREQLLSRLEERKWIDQAKRILSEIKRISEAEAYEFLRKQAMNERKRMVDVATSIVKVYQLLQDENQGGRKR